MSKRNYEHYALMIGEWLETISWSKTDYLNNVEIVGLENVSKYYEKGVGGFFLTCHLGNWEVLVSSGAAAGIPVDIIVKKAKYRFLEKIIVGYREKLGAGIIYETRTTRDILKKISQGRFVGFMLDQFMGPPLGIPARFFGKIAGTTVSLALLSDRRNTPVVPAFSFRRNGKLYTVIEPAFNWSLFDVPTDSMERLAFKTQVFNDWVEQKVREHPDQWLWLHHRWKPFVGETKWQN